MGILEVESPYVLTISVHDSNPIPSTGPQGPVSRNGPHHVVSAPDVRQTRSRDTYVGERTPVHSFGLEGTTTLMSTTSVP